MGSYDAGEDFVLRTLPVHRMSWMSKRFRQQLSISSSHLRSKNRITCPKFVPHRRETISGCSQRHCLLYIFETVHQHPSKTSSRPPEASYNLGRACHGSHTAAGESGAGFGHAGQAASRKCEVGSRGSRGVRTVIESLYAACDEKTAKTIEGGGSLVRRGAGCVQT